ncbi:amidohydrolase family protein [Oceanobacillus oncorhynchi subsp. oncorhynchi]|uniref:amidohydrolase family protein n=1 Tax=Oceanobacillus TaxID=182709 RepID=UPI0030F5AF40
MKVDLSNMRIIDNHCHPFILSREVKSFDNCFTLSLIPPKSQDTRNTLLFRMIRKELIDHFNLDPSITDDELIQFRNDLYHNNPEKYVNDLFKDSRVESFLVDYGFPVLGDRLAQEELDWFHTKVEDAGIKVRRVHRVEATFHPLFEKKVSFEDLETTFIRELRNEVENNHTIAFKTVIAYHTGLNIQEVTREEANAGYKEFLLDANNVKAEKKVRDYLVLQALELCMEYDIPMQMHSGAGDAPLNNLKLSSPILLHDIISNPAYRPAKIIFIHTAYPFVEEASYLANQYHNIYLDLSSMIPFSSIGAYTKLKQIFEMAPFTKVLYGSDGFTIPEVSWLGTKIIKNALEEVLNELIDKGIIDVDYAHKAAEMILSENARNLHHKNWDS